MPGVCSMKSAAAVLACSSKRMISDDDATPLVASIFLNDALRQGHSSPPFRPVAPPAMWRPSTSATVTSGSRRDRWYARLVLRSMVRSSTCTVHHASPAPERHKPYQRCEPKQVRTCITAGSSRCQPSLRAYASMTGPSRARQQTNVPRDAGTDDRDVRCVLLRRLNPGQDHRLPVLKQPARVPEAGRRRRRQAWGARLGETRSAARRPQRSGHHACLRGEPDERSSRPRPTSPPNCCPRSCGWLRPAEYRGWQERAAAVLEQAGSNRQYLRSSPGPASGRQLTFRPSSAPPLLRSAGCAARAPPPVALR
mmetsp:Transcript_21412/g.64238  ORF Transcript_21412/g.64238 Transcript_21412/m.64238 type:complete len:310 (-) Transcript_21412:511-1440(-)